MIYLENLKLLCDQSKFAILEYIKDKKAYGGELAKQLVLKIPRIKYIKRGFMLFTGLIFAACCITGCLAVHENRQTEYAVLLGEDASQIPLFPQADVLVVDGEYFIEADVLQLKEQGVKRVYSYLNVGSLETFRDYYAVYDRYTLGDYENWPEEKWVDVSQEKWQEFVVERANELILKGFDGLFIDNIDVYYQYPRQEIYEGIVSILTELHESGVYIMINGGDFFVREYIENGTEQGRIFDGVNQENVYTAYNFERKTYGVNPEEEREYWTEYLSYITVNGYEAYDLEYATDAGIAEAARKYAFSNGWNCYIADSIELINKK